MGKGTLAAILRCTGLALIVLGAFALLPAAAQGQGCTAGFHGVSIFKSCVSPKNRCGTDADCSDSDQCNGIEQCATEENPGSNVVECTITLSNPDIHCDNITILDAADSILNATGSGASSSTIQITGVSTGVVSGTCTAGTDLGGATTCTIAPGGSVQFLANYYTTVPTDPSTLNDQASINVQDTCSGGAGGCSTTPNTVQFTAATDTVSGCSPGTPLVCNDNNACTTDSCDPATGCVTAPVDCNDGLFCTDDSCDTVTGCQHTPHVCNDDLNCTTDTCNEANDVCDFTPVVCKQDANLCNTEACDPADGVCKSGPDTVCPDDSNLCNGPEACVPATGQCASGPPLNCDDGLFCTDDSCVPATGCTHTAHSCDDSNLCTTDTCNEDADTCVSTPVSCAPDSNLCTTEACDPTDGVCKSGPPTTCPDDDNLCNGTPACNPTTGACDPGTPVTCPDDTDLCNGVPVCNPSTGACDPGTPVVCDDPVCTACNPTTGICDLPANPLPAECNEEICRTPGFWGTHGGAEKNRSTNITQAILDTFGGTLTICGTTISNTNVGSPNSALEAICISPKGDSRLQLARQLTAAALNCGITNNNDEGTCSTDANGAAPCAGVSIGDVFDACNAACLTGTTAVVNGNTISCIEAIDCFNNGGIFDPATGTCADATGTSCHDRDLVNGCFDFSTPGPAGSSNACNDARKNNVTVLP